MAPLQIQVPLSVGELIDKITILEIKVGELRDEAKRQNVAHELALLNRVRSTHVPASAALDDATSRLRDVNRKLWQIEDQIRDCERSKCFDATFVALARSVYHTNDQRSAIKREINQLAGSEIVEEKSYAPY